MTQPPLLDANILVRHIVGDAPEHAGRATAFLKRVEDGATTVLLTDTVVFETVYVLQRFYQIPRPTIRDTVLPLLQLPGMILSGKTGYHRVFDWYVTYPKLSFADCYHAVLVRRLHLPAIISFDRDFDQLPDIARIEPD